MDNANIKTIQLLDNGMINKIAAGEVVERPSSVIKELVENAIDAGARAITVEIHDGGISYIRVTDNGKGIPGEQVRTAFLRHATSKISTMEDLINVMTLGFRGEALSSIASVAQVEMITKQASAMTGYRIEIDGGEVKKEGEIGCAEGTSFIIRNLFFNTPARRKFLKKPAIEGSYISDLMNKLVLGHPDISFTYINNSSVILQSNGNGDLKTAIFYVYGRETAGKLLPVSFANADVRLSGFTAKPEVSRGNRTYENFFINGRYIKSELIQSAVEEAYRTRLPIGKFPLFVLNMEIRPDMVDVNVHPAKLEIRFSNENLIYESVKAAVEDALHGVSLIPKVNLELKKAEPIIISEDYAVNEEQKSLVDLIYPVKPKQEVKPAPMPNYIREKSVEIPYVDKSVELPSVEVEQESLIAKTSEVFTHHRVIGQMFQTYWLVEQDQSLFLIDQHAAHERILYEEFIVTAKTSSISSQQMLNPIMIKLSEKEITTVRENAKLIGDFGFEFEEYGDGEFALKGIPFLFKSPVKTELFAEIIERLGSLDTSVSSIYDTKLHTIATISCRAAVKGNDKLDYAEAKALIDRLMKLENPFTCPHGRPTIIEFTKYEIEKRFQRVM